MEITPYIHNNKLHILARPNAKKTEILGILSDGKTVKIAVAAPADKDKANKELLKFLTKMLKKKVVFVSGLRSREKVVTVLD